MVAASPRCAGATLGPARASPHDVGPVVPEVHVPRIYLSPPDVGPVERDLLLDAFDSGWVAPLGPHVDAFESELASVAGVVHAAALSSGTAALHLALLLLGVGPGHDVVVPTLTFVATLNAVRYTGARPVLVDAEASTWGIDPDLVDEELASRRAGDRPVGAVISVDLYGQCAQQERLEQVCAAHGVPLVEDAAEALGASRRGRPAGSFGELATFSFNGNKLVTTSGGGMLVGDDGETIARARHLATQAREPAAHYEHVDLGYNYRLSNLLAAVGRGQLRRLDELVAARRRTFGRYAQAFADVEGITPMPIDPDGDPSHWLTVVTIDPERFGADREEVRLALAAEDIEARPAWKPMHLQPLYADAPTRRTDVADQVWAQGLCLPSGGALTDEDLDRIVGLAVSVRP